MTNYRVFKFLAGCGIASLLLAGCGSDEGPGLSKISTAAEAQSASAATANVMAGGFSPEIDFGAAAPTLKSPQFASLLAKNHAAKIKAAKARSASFAAQAVTEVGVAQDCGPDPDDGTYTVTAYDEEVYAVTYNQCVTSYIDGELKINGKLYQSSVENADGFVTEIFKLGNADGTANLANDYSMTFTGTDPADDFEIVGDVNEKYVWYDDYTASFSNKNFSDSSRGQIIIETTDKVVKVVANESGSGKDSYDSTGGTETDVYSGSGNIKVSEVVGTDTTSTEMIYSVSGTSIWDTTTWETSDDSNGTVTITLTSPLERDDCSSINGTYKFETIHPLIIEDGEDYPTSGELLINNNTTVVFSGPGDVEITLDGDPVYGPASIDDLMLAESETCSLATGLYVEIPFVSTK